jgi:hypothetical protein
MLSNVSQVTVIRGEPEKDSGLVENVPASSSASEELSLRVEISRLRTIEYLIDELALRNAKIVYLQQMLEKTQVSSNLQHTNSKEVVRL